MRTALFWYSTQRVLVINYRRFGQPISPIWKGHESMGSMGFPETSVSNYHYSLCNSQEDPGFLLLGDSNIRLTNYIMQDPWDGSSSSTGHEILALYGSRRFITVFTRTITWPCTEPMYPVHVLQLHLRYILILSSHPMVSFLQLSPPISCMRFSSSPHLPYATTILASLTVSPD
jgi:hypothetical protein